MKDLTLRKIKNTDFINIYKELFTGRSLNKSQYLVLLSMAVIFLNSEDQNVKNLGYRIIVIYCNKENDYKPLYEIAINLGLIPIVKFISSIDRYSRNSTLYTELNEVFSENFLYDGLYRSVEQKKLIDFYFENKNNAVSIVAPTSYGKTELIIATLKSCQNKNICIITPTKSLLAQTKSRIKMIEINGNKKVITHPEMYNEDDENIIAVLTQERLLRLLKKSDELSFDYIIVDEAHTLLNDDSRSTLLAVVLVLLEKRNKDTVFKFLTPFLCSSNNLKVRYTNYTLNEFYVSEYIKTEKYYIFDTEEHKLYFYDQYTDKFFELNLNKNIDDVNFIEYKKTKKNIVYLNKPVDIEEFAYRLSKGHKFVNCEDIEKACEDISNYIHPNYNIINCLKKGLIYHHGSVPDSIRLYIEKLYESVSCIEHVITSSTLLEGVNLPAERIFILDNKKGRRNLSQSNFKNLIGRICRFNDIFKGKNADLSKLEPEIYIIKGKYFSQNSNIKDFLSNCTKVDKEIKDHAENILLKTVEVNDVNEFKLNKAREFIENYENNTINDYSEKYVRTEAGKLCFKNNIVELDIFEMEKNLQKKIELYKLKNIIFTNAENLIEGIYKLFIEKNNISDLKLSRFNHLETRKFYIMFLNWRIKNASYSEMIKSFLLYWDKLISDNKETLVYVGKWGDERREGHNNLWIDVKKKNNNQKINLAIVRIKEEQDFLDNTIIKFIEVLNDLELLEPTLYLNIKYGTSNKNKIVLIKNGLSLSLSNLIVDTYNAYVNINIEKSTVEFNKKLVDAMKQSDENSILITEAEYLAQ